MKKLASLILGLVFLGFTSIGQVKPQPKKTEKTPSAVPSTTAASKLKKDGTADKRFKENKHVETRPFKKDGTPDKRFKKNKS